MRALAEHVAELGVPSSQLVDLAEGETPRNLRYRDLQRVPTAGELPVVVEVQGQPFGYVFALDGVGHQADTVGQWVRRIAFRGDAAWVGVLRPGRIDVYPATLTGKLPTPMEGVRRGPALFQQLAHAHDPPVKEGVRGRLLVLLHRSIENAKQLGVAAPDALSLVGRALFWRFLIDRRLLDGLPYGEVCPGVSSWEECFATKKAALHTFAWMDETFNGSLLPLSASPSTYAAEVFTRVLGNIAYLATPEGQLPLRLPRGWNEVNFAHVPVGLLSEVYEAYAHSEDKAQAKAESVFFTPRHIAEMVVDDALAAVDLCANPRILDPAAGAGVFLVATYRALVARAWSRSGKRPTRAELRRILNTQLVGFDINDSALRLAELALYLTAIELDPQQKPRPLSLLRFDRLRDTVLFQPPGGSAVGSLAAVEARFRGKFDVVLGNPPWTAKRKGPTEQKDATKAKWADDTRALVAARIGQARAAKFDFPDMNPDLPFVFRAMEWAREGGCIALVTHARWLFTQTAPGVQTRNDLLDAVHVTGVLNGAALRDTNVWPNVRHPFCLLFAANEVAPPGARFLFVSPDLDHVPDSNQRRLRIDWNAAQPVTTEEVARVPWTLKARFRATHFDAVVTERIARHGVPLRRYVESLNCVVCNGYQVDAAGTQKSARDLLGLPDLRDDALPFRVNASALPTFARKTLHRSRSRDLYRAPLLLLDETMRADPYAPRSGISEDDVAFDERFDGVSFHGVPDGWDIARYLQVVVQSSLFRHALLLRDAQFGVEREVVHAASLHAVPVIPWAEVSMEARSRALALSDALASGHSPALLEAIDAFVFGMFDLSVPERDAVRDTLATSMPTAAAKAAAVRRTTDDERRAFAALLEKELNDILAASDEQVTVRLRGDLCRIDPFAFLQLDRGPMGSRSATQVDVELSEIVNAADLSAVSMVVLHGASRTMLLGLLDRFRYWTRTRARLVAAAYLAGDLGR